MSLQVRDSAKYCDVTPQSSYRRRTISQATTGPTFLFTNAVTSPLGQILLPTDAPFYIDPPHTHTHPPPPLWHNKRVTDWYNSKLIRQGILMLSQLAPTHIKPTHIQINVQASLEETTHGRQQRATTSSSTLLLDLVAFPTGSQGLGPCQGRRQLTPPPPRYMEAITHNPFHNHTKTFIFELLGSKLKTGYRPRHWQPHLLHCFIENARKQGTTLFSPAVISKKPEVC